ncbi:hypothetical protein JOD57_002033 [Geodermatophilus bullaregiensis]|uniref:helix-turn-helix transcriptional regulator n=1 Tax=Geodermatophilus bullaregiensis TaxID=1564160 RepID=UPI00195EEF29|nr:helix-turn-helix domain-containing protein [Geodermatophilus bullaregiensis]MBM7806196.1 hypothetical protein [Geodermatophilus bullaregiensis]
MLSAPETRKGRSVAPAAVQSQDGAPPVFVRRSEAAAFLGLTTGTMANWASAGRGPAFHRVGSRVLYDLAELVRFVAAGRVETVDAA